MKIRLYIDRKLKITVCITIIIAIVLSTVAIKTSITIKAQEQESISIPILMYHSVLKDSKYQGDYVISPDLLESDLKYIKDNGYTTIVMQDVINYVYNDVPLPEKPIMITFDDGYYNNYLYAYPLMEKYDTKMVLSIIAKLTDDFSKTNETSPYYAHVSWNNVNEMIASNRVEIQNHSYDLHHQSGKGMGVKKSKSESTEEYKKRIKNDLENSQNLIEANTGIRPTTFVYPFGYTNDMSTDIIKEEGFSAALLVENKDSKITKSKDSLYNMKRYLRQGKISTETYMKSKGI